MSRPVLTTYTARRAIDVGRHAGSPRCTARVRDRAFASRQDTRDVVDRFQTFTGRGALRLEDHQSGGFYHATREPDSTTTLLYPPAGTCALTLLRDPSPAVSSARGSPRGSARRRAGARARTAACRTGRPT